MPTNDKNKAEESDTKSALYTDEQLTNIKSFEDAIALLAEAGVDVTDIADYGDGFSVMDKRAFLGVPFIILDYKFADGKYDSGFTVVRVVAKNEETGETIKGLFTDGSTGIRKQLGDIRRKQELANKPQAGIMVKNGLTISEYEWVGIETDKDDPEYGKEVRKPSETFYLSM